MLIKPTKPHKRSDVSLISLITARIRGVIAASRYVLCTYNIQASHIQKGLEITPGRRAATVTPLAGGEWNAINSMVLKADVAGVMDKLEAAGASDILITAISNCRV